MAKEDSTASSTPACSFPLAAPDHDEHDAHNMWNPTLELFCCVDIGVLKGAVLDDKGLERIALSCHFALDIFCGKDVCLLP